MMRTIFAALILPFLIMGAGPSAPLPPETPKIFWDPVRNISRSPEKTSTDPYVLADPSGRVHLFWAEKTTNDPVNQADTLMYAVWDGKVWSKPIDIFTTVSLNPLIAFPKAILDDKGFIHLVWMDQPNYPRQTVFYSTVFVEDAASSNAWSAPVALASNLTGTKFSFDLAYSPPDTFHLLYARVEQGDNPPELRAVTYLRSADRGQTWSSPLDLYTVQEYQYGASDTRLLVNGQSIYASWTEWDTSGLGRAVFFTRSTDGGDSWDTPRPLSVRRPTDYERDWNNLALLEEDNLVSVWEGGYRAYRQFMYSFDGGVTWTEPVDEFPWLIGENGSAEFVRDSAGRLFLFVAQRVREGSDQKGGVIGLWYSVWQGNRSWSEPVLAGGSNPMLNPRVAIMNGNRIAAAWYSSTDLEVQVLTGEILNAPAEEPISWPRIFASDSAEDEEPSPTPSAARPQLPTPTGISSLTETERSPTPSMNVGLPIAFGIVPAIAIILLIAFAHNRMRGGPSSG